MAGGQLSLTRRAVLAGGCAVSVGADVAGRGRFESGSGSGVPGGLPHQGWTPDQAWGDGVGVGRWRGAFERYRIAEAAVRAAGGGGDEAGFDRAVGRFNAALKRLVRTPAPDLRALALKLDLMLEEELWELTGADRCLDALRRDAHRFAGG